MPVYLVAQIRIDDRERYGQYEAGFLAVFQQYGGEIVAVDDDADVAEGDWPYTRMVILRFANREAADAWYQSDAYQELAKIRRESSEGVLSIVKGFV